MKTRNERARAVQNITGMIMLAAGVASVIYVHGIALYNIPALVAGTYVLLTKRLLVA